MIFVLYANGSVLYVYFYLHYHIYLYLYTFAKGNIRLRVLHTTSVIIVTFACVPEWNCVGVSRNVHRITLPRIVTESQPYGILERDRCSIIRTAYMIHRKRHNSINEKRRGACKTNSRTHNCKLGMEQTKRLWIATTAYTKRHFAE